MKDNLLKHLRLSKIEITSLITLELRAVPRGPRLQTQNCYWILTEHFYFFHIYSRVILIGAVFSFVFIVVIVMYVHRRATEQESEKLY